MDIDLKNINMSDIKDQIIKLADKKTLIKIGIIFGAIVFFLIIYYAILNPMVESRKAKLDDMNLKIQETAKFTSEIYSMRARIKKLKPDYEKYSSLFHSKAEVEALTQISQLGYEQGKLAELKTQHQVQETAAKDIPVQNTRQPVQQAPARDPKAEAWAEENEWFGKDNAMTYTAFDLHRKLTEEEGMDPQSDEYYREVDRRIRLEFPHKFDRPVEEKQTTKPTQNVASATRSTKSGRKQVRLTSSQVAIARKLGVPLEEYAKQLINTKEV